jgi:predicted DNA-binding protein with PD1-like motif
MKDGAPFVHAHVLFGDADGASFGGHRMPLRCTQTSRPPERLFDDTTGLYF